MRCRKCKKEVPNRIFGYCKKCAKKLGARGDVCGLVYRVDELYEDLKHKCPECPSDNIKAILDETNTCKVCGTQVIRDDGVAGADGLTHIYEEDELTQLFFDHGKLIDDQTEKLIQAILKWRYNDRTTS